MTLAYKNDIIDLYGKTATRVSGMDTTSSKLAYELGYIKATLAEFITDEQVGQLLERINYIDQKGANGHN